MICFEATAYLVSDFKLLYLYLLDMIGLLLHRSGNIMHSGGEVNFNLSMI